VHLCCTTCYLLGLGLASPTKLAWLAWLGWAPWAAWGGPGLAGWLAGRAIWGGWDGRLAGNMKDFCVFGFEFIRPDFFFGSRPKKTHLETSFFQFEFIRPGPEPSLFGHFRVYSASFEFIRLEFIRRPNKF